MNPGVDIVEPVEIVGLGASGVSAARFLHRNGVAAGLMDTRREPPGLAELSALGIAGGAVLGELDQQRLERAGTIILSPGLPLASPSIVAAVEAGTDVIGDIELFARHVRAPVIAVTGSNGKSTVTTMVRDMALAAGQDVRAGGNLGPAALDLCTGVEPSAYVLELSSFQLETTRSLKTSAAALLNLSEDHLDRYADMAAYAAAKARIFVGAALCVAGDQVPTPAGRAVVRFGLGVPADGDYGLRTHAGEIWLARGADRYLRAADLPVPGRHNALNALAALALGDALALPRDAMCAALRAFRGLEHRCELVSTAGGVRWINDSKGTNVGAAVAAVEGLADAGPIWLIAGGLGKGQDFGPLGAAVRGRVAEVVLLGADRALVAASLPDTVARTEVPDLRAAVQHTAAHAGPGDTVLLSPACASFDMFASYAERGTCFRALVGEVTGA
ncbi:MAG: UDP-N-acetylmuramoyl-L-alanine--D-glutamate ligase [Pseudomonadota bacterium]